MHPRRKKVLKRRDNYVVFLLLIAKNIRNFNNLEATVKWRRFSSPGRRFSAMPKWRRLRTNDGGLTCMNWNNVILQADRNIFALMVLVAEGRHLRVCDVLSHTLGPLPSALDNGDGAMRKTNKAALARELEKQVLPAETIPEPSATMIDDMSLVQKMKGNDHTFTQLAESALTYIVHEGDRRSHRIDVVFDTYREDSTKNSERSNRGNTIWIQFRNMAACQRIQQWSKFLISLANKVNLISFLVAEWKAPKLTEKLNDKQLYVASEKTRLHITNDQWAEVAGLQSNQADADTIIILHAAHAAEEGTRAVVVTADDTDVMVLFQICETKNRVMYIDINKLCHGLEDGVCNYLIGMHAYTGCDTVSAFAGRGKLGALKLLRSEHWQEMFRELGQSGQPSVNLFKKLQAFTCKLYTSSATTVDINTGRHQLFCARVGSSSLPSFHHGRTASSSIPCTLSTMLASGEAISNNIRKSQAQSSVAGSEMMMISSPWHGCGGFQLPMQCCSCCRASSAVYASSRNVSACATAWHVQTCASCKYVTINPKRRTLTRWLRRQTWLTVKQTTEMEESS